MQSPDAVEPADCHVHALHLAATVEQIRRDMGRAADPRPAVQIAGASPRECWFAALAVHRKAARLAAEWGADASEPIAHPPAVDKIRPGHVLQVIGACRRHLDGAARAIGLTDAAAASPARDAASTPSHVLGVLVTAGRQLDRLLARPISPGDVHAQVATALAYTARLTGAEALATPAFERGKSPGHCYQALHDALEAARALIKRAGHPVIESAPVAGDLPHVVPSDCFDLATLLLGEVAFLHALKADTNPPAAYEAVVAGRKLPSHVFQLTGVLRAQLDRLTR